MTVSISELNRWRDNEKERTTYRFEGETTRKEEAIDLRSIDLRSNEGEKT